MSKTLNNTICKRYTEQNFVAKNRHGFTATNVLQKEKLFCTHCIASFFNIIDTIGINVQGS